LHQRLIIVFRVMDTNIQWVGGIEVQITLREGDDDAGGVEFLVDRGIQFTGHRQAVIQGFDETAQDQCEGIVAKGLEGDYREE
jgi:hypothetical protein